MFRTPEGQRRVCKHDVRFSLPVPNEHKRGGLVHTTHHRQNGWLKLTAEMVKISTTVLVPVRSISMYRIVLGSRHSRVSPYTPHTTIPGTQVLCCTDRLFVHRVDPSRVVPWNRRRRRRHTSGTRPTIATGGCEARVVRTPDGEDRCLPPRCT
jgi:hypothetical protein